MQEEVENRTVNLAISTTKLTGRSLVNAFRAYLNHRRNVKARKASIQDTHIVGEQTIAQLLGQNQGATNIEIEKTEIADFKRILNKYGVDYAITRDRSILWAKGIPKKIFRLSLRVRKSIVPESNLPWQKRNGHSIFCLSLMIKFGQKDPAISSGLQTTI